MCHYNGSSLVNVSGRNLEISMLARFFYSPIAMSELSVLIPQQFLTKRMYILEFFSVPSESKEAS